MRPGALLAPQGVQGPHREIAPDGIRGETESPATAPTVPSGWLEALAVKVRLRRIEWRVIAIVISSPHPMRSSSIAKRLGLDYGLVKRIVRELTRWNILERAPAGLTFQPDHTRWGPPRPPSTT
jgi:hypothetical protein